MTNAIEITKEGYRPLELEPVEETTITIVFPDNTPAAERVLLADKILKALKQ